MALSEGLDVAVEVALWEWLPCGIRAEVLVTHTGWCEGSLRVGADWGVVKERRWDNGALGQGTLWSPPHHFKRTCDFEPAKSTCDNRLLND